MFISSAGAYAIAAYVDGPFMPWIGFVFIMGHMSINQLNRQFANAPDKVDITGKAEHILKWPMANCVSGAQMVLVMKVRLCVMHWYDRSVDRCKLTAFCWNVQDGRLPEKDLVDFQKERALTKLPSLLDFAGYVVRFSAD